MSSSAFDTHAAVKNLQGAGAAEPLAETVVATIGDAISQVATKADLKDIRRELEDLKRGQGTLENALEKGLEDRPTKADLKMLEQHLTIRLGGLLVGGIVILATMMQIL